MECELCGVTGRDTACYVPMVKWQMVGADPCVRPGSQIEHSKCMDTFTASKTNIQYPTENIQGPSIQNPELNNDFLKCLAFIYLAV